MPHAAGADVAAQARADLYVCFMKCEIEDDGFSMRTGSWQITTKASA